MSAELTGSIPVLVTPLNDQYEVDISSLLKLVRYYLDAGVDGIIALGESSERDALSPAERETILRTVFKEVGGAVPIIVGTGEDNAELTLQASRHAEELGAKAVMIPPPRLPELKGEEILEYYKYVGERVRVPIVVQDYPQNTRPRMPPDLIAKIHNTIPNATYLKLEDPPTPPKIREVLKLTGNKMKVFGALYGRDSFWELEEGAAGIMTATPTPEYLVDMVESHFKGLRQRAMEIYYLTTPLTHFYPELGLAVRKQVLAFRDVIATPKVRPPRKGLDETQRKQLRETLNWVEDALTAKLGIKPIHFTV
ncbi:hypothetical protein B9Q03_06975 [Candidatus Marsarchaeota G2 archaeon OSP_D]|jgi:Dihydrodipicolinate synthase/N-acetylneuraminate lyase|uniref:Dihydrodipicolinate synthase family protein n=2 Tax=Candidatus Marsarchaeota group 2 TaxID=2203771 RepID=A0A2R6AVI0_9ARCH|nr:MAG: hypothetical protein B9Q03_06975 [Candidatus Marsarchaeota G2 archaeon OSP_D]PSO02189.1 MAG: hypothetical protein B9Q05_05710 [Candidatus Marsarchaeota G2 archaeon ECH_B_1]